MRRSLAALAAVALLGGAIPLHAQDEDDAMAYVALIFTPTGGLAPMLPSALTAAKQAGPSFGVRYGYLDILGIGMHGLAATMDLPMGARGSNLGLSAGYQFVNCDDGLDCEGHPLIGGSYDTRLTRGTGTTPVSLALSTNLGAAFPNGGKMYSASVGLPIFLEAEMESGGRVVPFITPGLGWGHASLEDELLGDTSGSAFRFMLGGGVTIVTTRGMSFGLGVQKVFIDGGDLQLGAGFTFGGRRSN